MADNHGNVRDRTDLPDTERTGSDRNHEASPGVDPWDRRLDESLQRLPRETARLGFTTRVISNLDRPADLGSAPAPRSWLTRWPALVGVAAALLVAVVAGREWWHQQRLQESLDRIAALRVEQQALEEELLQLRQMVSDAKPVLHLGSNGDVDWVLDLRRLRQGDRIVVPDYLRQGMSPSQGLRPASSQRRADVRSASLHARPTY